MGAKAGHVYEAEYCFDQSESLDELREDIINALKSTQLYEVTDNDTADRLLFKRQGEVNNLKYAYPPGLSCDKEKTVFGVHTTAGIGFKDDMAFTFFTRDGNPTVKTLSLSRIGGSDWGQNAKNVNGIMDQLKQKPISVNIIRDTNHPNLIVNEDE